VSGEASNAGGGMFLGPLVPMVPEAASPPVPETIIWIASHVRIPETDRLVLIYTPEDQDDPVSEGWWDCATDSWFIVSGFPVGMVTWWAEKPKGPTR
jgi:hypothetical protein